MEMGRISPPAPRPDLATKRAGSDPLVAVERDVQRRLDAMPRSATVFRLGDRSDPLGFTPRHRCSWAHRWDDPLREYRTLYCAKTEATCFREVFADLRPNAKMLAEERFLFGAPEELRSARGVISRECLAHMYCRGQFFGRMASL